MKTIKYVKYVKYVKRDIEVKAPLMFCLAVGVAAIIASGCGKKHAGRGLDQVTDPVSKISSALPSAGDALSGSDDRFVVRSRALMNLSTVQDSALAKFFQKLLPSAYAASVSQSIVVTNAASVTMILDSSQFLVPSVSNKLLDFGSLAISTLSDNNLKVCGTGGKTQCGTAMIRIYTSGQAGAGVWNAADSYGVPLYSGLQNVNSSSIGLNAAGSVTVQSTGIASSDHVLTLSDFHETSRFQVQADFSNAGAGSYATTLVIEYVLSL